MQLAYILSTLGAAGFLMFFSFLLRPWFGFQEFSNQNYSHDLIATSKETSYSADVCIMILLFSGRCLHDVGQPYWLSYSLFNLT